MMDVTIPRVSLCSTPGCEPLARLGHSTFQVTAAKLMILSLSEAVWWLFISLTVVIMWICDGFYADVWLCDMCVFSYS